MTQDRNALGHPIAHPDPLARFAEKCRFNPATGCVEWTGGTTSGRGTCKLVYGSFWFEGRRWFAHRWSAQHIHGHTIDGLQVDHYCPALANPNPLCVEHCRPETQADNLALRFDRAAQTPEQRRYWLFVSLGIEPAPHMLQADPVPGEDIPFFDPPEWLRPYLPAKELIECPF